MKVERRFKKKTEKKPKEEALIVLGEWISGGEESSTNSSDESTKRFTTRINMGMASSSNICLMAKGMKNDISDEDSDSPSYKEFLDLVHEHQRAIKKQFKKCDALNATLATNYDNLLCKFQMLSKEYEELKLKIESITKETNDSLEMEQSIPCEIPISKVDDSCIDLIDKSCSNPCNEK